MQIYTAKFSLIESSGNFTIVSQGKNLYLKKPFKYLKQELINTWIHISGNVTKSLFWMDYPITYSVTAF